MKLPRAQLQQNISYTRWRVLPLLNNDPSAKYIYTLFNTFLTHIAYLDPTNIVKCWHFSNQQVSNTWMVCDLLAFGTTSKWWKPIGPQCQMPDKQSACTWMREHNKIRHYGIDWCFLARQHRKANFANWKGEKQSQAAISITIILCYFIYLISAAMYVLRQQKCRLGLVSRVWCLALVSMLWPLSYVTISLFITYIHSSFVYRCLRPLKQNFIYV